MLFIQTLQAQENKRGYRGIVETGFSISTGWQGSESNHFEVSMSNGYRFAAPVFLGIGVGYDRYFDDKYSAAYLLFADMRYDLRWAENGRVYPFIGLKFGGRLVHYKEEGEGEFYTVPTVGVKWELKRKMALNLSMGYSATGTTGIALKAGFEF